MATKKPAKAKSLYKEDDTIGDKEGIDLKYNQDTFAFELRFTNKEIGNNYFVKHALKSALQTDMQWTGIKGQPKPEDHFKIEAEHIGKLYPAITSARELSKEILTAKDELKHIVAQNFGKPAETLAFTHVLGLEKERHNGEIMGINKYFVIQKAGIGKDDSPHAGKQFFHIHQVQKFMHTAQDWAHIEQTLDMRFRKGETVSILYGEKNKAIVQDYRPTQSREQAPQQRQQFSQAM